MRFFVSIDIFLCNSARILIKTSCRDDMHQFKFNGVWLHSLIKFDWFSNLSHTILVFRGNSVEWVLQSSIPKYLIAYIRLIRTSGGWLSANTVQLRNNRPKICVRNKCAHKISPVVEVATNVRTLANTLWLINIHRKYFLYHVKSWKSQWCLVLRYKLFQQRYPRFDVQNVWCLDKHLSLWLEKCVA